MRKWWTASLLNIVNRRVSSLGVLAPKWLRYEEPGLLTPTGSVAQPDSCLGKMSSPVVNGRTVGEAASAAIETVLGKIGDAVAMAALDAALATVLARHRGGTSLKSAS